ncbi:MAG: NAD-dependent epimerase/dehydratase family protein, partial [bacterium]
MRILVTGGAGFIGSWVAEILLEYGHYVVIVDNLSNGLKSNIPSGAKFYKLDILSDEIDKLFASERFDVVNHHAARIDLFSSKANPDEDIRVNLTGTINLLKHSVKHGVRRFVFASSGGAIYNPEFGLPSKEEYEYAPPSPYGINKLAAEKYILYFNREYGLGYTILRYSNVYGPRQGLSFESGVVSIFARAMLKNDNVVIFGDGTQTRDFVYVEDIARVNRVATEGNFNGTFNISSSKGTTINEL